MKDFGWFGRQLTRQADLHVACYGHQLQWILLSFLMAASLKTKRDLELLVNLICRMQLCEASYTVHVSRSRTIIMQFLYMVIHAKGSITDKNMLLLKSWSCFITQWQKVVAKCADTYIVTGSLYNLIRKK